MLRPADDVDVDVEAALDAHKALLGAVRGLRVRFGGRRARRARRRRRGRHSEYERRLRSGRVVAQAEGLRSGPEARLQEVLQAAKEAAEEVRAALRDGEAELTEARAVSDDARAAVDASNAVQRARFCLSAATISSLEARSRARAAEGRVCEAPPQASPSRGFPIALITLIVQAERVAPLGRRTRRRRCS